MIDLRRRAIAHFQMTVKSRVVHHEGPEALAKYGVIATPHERTEGKFRSWNSAREMLGTPIKPVAGTSIVSERQWQVAQFLRQALRMLCSPDAITHILTS